MHTVNVSLVKCVSFTLQSLINQYLHAYQSSIPLRLDATGRVFLAPGQIYTATGRMYTELNYICMLATE